MQTEIRKKIKFGETEILVTNVYPFMYSNGKIVLRVSALEKDTDEATLKLLKDNQGVIEQWEQTVTTNDDGTVIEGEWELKMTHENYNSGDYTSSYATGEYSCEVTKLSKYDIELKKTRADVDFVMAMEGLL